MKTETPVSNSGREAEGKMERAQRRMTENAANRIDRWYPRFHIASQSGWINDPNGLCYFKGRWHVYYQLNPYEPVWGTMYWGHVSSKDLVKWRREPIALAPGTEDDRDGIFSGSAVVDDQGGLCIYYTGQRWVNGHDDREGQVQVQMMARALDQEAAQFEKLGRVVAPPESQPIQHFRDPKVWKQDGVWYMIHGAGSPQGRGQIWLYTSTDMVSWTFQNVIFEDPDPDVFMVECPDLFPLTSPSGDTIWVLCLSEMRRNPDEPEGEDVVTAGYMLGEFSPETGFMARSGLHLWDYGHNFYAPQSFEAPDGRRIIYGWMKPDLSTPMPTIEDGWNGQLTLPRVVTLDSTGRIRTVPAAELDGLRGDSDRIGPVRVPADGERVICDDLEAGEVILDIDLKTSGFRTAGLRIQATPDGTYTSLSYDRGTCLLVLDRGQAARGDRTSRTVKLHSDIEESQLRLHIYVDRGSIEVYVNHGQEVLTSYSFPAAGPRGLILTSSGGDMALNQCTITAFDGIGLDDH